MQCKDVDEKPILLLLATQPYRDYHWWDLPDSKMPSVLQAFPEEARAIPKLVLAKMGGLIRRGLVDGCYCGCRGDFRITYHGLLYMSEKGWVDDSVFEVLP